MKASSGMTGYGNGQCVSEVCEQLGTVSLYGHNQHYKIYDIDRVVEYPKDIEQLQAEKDEIERLKAKDWLTCPKHIVSWLKSDGEECPVCKLQAELDTAKQEADAIWEGSNAQIAELQNSRDKF